MNKAEFECPKCRATILAPPSLAGESSDCPKCGKDVDRWPQPKMLVTRAELVPREDVSWFYIVNGHQRGPVTESQLRAMIEAGMVRGTDLIWREGLPEWVQVSLIPGLLPRSLVKPPPLPPVQRLDDEEEQTAPRRGLVRRQRQDEDDEEEERRARRRRRKKAADQGMGVGLLILVIFLTLLIPLIGIIVGVIDMGKEGRRRSEGTGILIFALFMVIIHMARMADRW